MLFFENYFYNVFSFNIALNIKTHCYQFDSAFSFLKNKPNLRNLNSRRYKKYLKNKQNIGIFGVINTIPKKYISLLDTLINLGIAVKAEPCARVSLRDIRL